ncbi:hybrid sensor histidine kinase/response regulator [Butyrivibrio sp. AE2032]|uniref:hybrid sensor histidine kinase/response regulator n=1 Tax=Butyrivibrio sp. AE2032 TaxID=1458463 RepID=UPI00068F318A|nr:two-component regulator propeller domain-containing protein [Butyrivibrio sp. AE2032]
MLKKRHLFNLIAASFGALVFMTAAWENCAILQAAEGAETGQETVATSTELPKVGGGYAVTGQIGLGGYATKIYDVTNGLPTSDANYILGASDGYVWIGSYGGIIRYDGSVFEKITNSEGLTSGRGLFEDSRGRIWVGTNDNGVVVLDGEVATWITYKDGLPSSSIRVFAEDNYGNVFIGTTAGICYADSNLKIHVVNDRRINSERILSLTSDPEGVIYGQTKNGLVFAIKEQLVIHCYHSEELGMANRITNIQADPENKGYVYIGTEGSEVYYGKFGDTARAMRHVSVAPLSSVKWLNYDCGRLWVSSISQLGYLDRNDSFHLLKDLPINSGIEMVTSDYQGNIWVASSTQGIMKIVASNFIDLSQKTDLPQEVTNATCLIDGVLYVGTDSGLRIIGRNNKVLENELTDFIGNARVRYLMSDDEGNLWISTYNNILGLVRYSKNGEITNFTMEEGMPSNEIRCTLQAEDGSILVGTNNGLARINRGRVEILLDADPTVKNTVFMAVEEGDNGEIYVGTDGDGIYAISKSDIRKIGRDDGLTSDVIRRIKRDEQRDLFWILTSNSIEYMKDGVITQVTSFPYNNNYDFVFDKNGNMWMISSNGLFMVDVQEMLQDKVTDFKEYTLANGITSTPTANSFSFLDEDGNLYMAGRSGVCKVNIDHFFEEDMLVETKIKSVYSGEKKILPDAQGRYVLPSSSARVKIAVSVLDYTLTDPPVRIFMEGDEQDQILVSRSAIPQLEYTGMKHGDYKLHVQVLDNTRKKLVDEEVFRITKKSRLFELMIVRVFTLILIALLTGLLVWHVMKNTVIRRQYNEIKQARDDAERANSAKTRFLANISHEIRTPINTILGMDEMIMREDATDVPKGYFISMMNYAFDIKNASDTLLGLINDLLDISKIESGKMHLVEQEYEVQDLLRSIVSMIRVKSTEKELMFDVVVDELIPQRLFGDAGKIKQIVLNLLTNAVKYTGKGGVVLSVSMEERSDDLAKIRFSVKDTGIGVKAEDMDKLFTAYERLDEQKNSGIQGTGLGLDISRRFAELMGGTLTCESVYGEGSDFILELSQKIVDATPIGLFVEHDDSTAKGPYVPQFVAPDADVLVVDDNPMNLSVIKGLLKATKIFVTTASSGEECLEKMKTTKFNVVLLDHMMPGMDGIETVGHIRETDPDIPVYALTANATSGEEFYKSKGFTGYLSKPIDSYALEKAIMRHLPEEIMFKPKREDAVAEMESIPEELGWIRDVEGIDVDEGIKNSGGISQFIFSLKLFLETIEGNSKVISDAYEAGDIRLYTIKVHALKSSCRIIGATKLSKLAESLEDAGNKDNKEFIDMYTDELLTGYAEFKSKLAGLDEGAAEDDDSDKKEISEDELQDAYGALKDVVPQMDYDAVEMILGQLNEYKLPKEEKEKVAQLSKMLKVFDWEGMEELINQ